MTAKQYRKKPVVVEAMEFTGDNANDIARFVGEELGPFPYGKCDYFTIETLEGDMTARVGDYIIKGVKGEFYPCRSDIFEATYEEAN